ncbi:hypothetical protein QAD02_003256 [Eretmocerus hayati]|uniref:Uncharacterized protein n=1 Tax=Eretmocerus hayati TaxID=131215 RepID=A0ACC2NP24_9HYME|nr:hypothetical protein QAD02_003256 [Eretmocerus hayati]
MHGTTSRVGGQYVEQSGLEGRLIHSTANKSVCPVMAVTQELDRAARSHPLPDLGAENPSFDEKMHHVIDGQRLSHQKFDEAQLLNRHANEDTMGTKDLQFTRTLKSNRVQQLYEEDAQSTQSMITTPLLYNSMQTGGSIGGGPAVVSTHNRQHDNNDHSHMTRSIDSPMHAKIKPPGERFILLSEGNRYMAKFRVNARRMVLQVLPPPRDSINPVLWLESSIRDIWQYIVDLGRGDTFECCRVKEITLNYENSLKINFESINQLLDSYSHDKDGERGEGIGHTIDLNYRAIRRTPLHEVVTRDETKTCSIVLKKRWCVSKELSLLFGYCPTDYANLIL